MSSSMADEHRARIEVFEYTAVEVIILFYGVREAGEVFIYTVPEKYLYIGLHLSNTFPRQKKAIVVFKYTSPAPEKYLYTPCRRSIYTLLRRRISIYIHRRSIYMHRRRSICILLRRRRSRRSWRSRRSIYIHPMRLVAKIVHFDFSYRIKKYLGPL